MHYFERFFYNRREETAAWSWAGGFASAYVSSDRPPDRLPPARCQSSKQPTSKAVVAKIYTVTVKSHYTAPSLLEAGIERRRELLQELIVSELARVLRCGPSRIDVHQPLTRLGLDSLMAVELQNRLEGALKVRLPVAELLKGPTIVELAARIADEMAHPAPPAPGITCGPTHEDLLARLDQLSDEEVDALLRARKPSASPPEAGAD